MGELTTSESSELDAVEKAEMEESLDTINGRREFLGGALAFAGGLSLLSPPDARALTESGKKEHERLQVSEHARPTEIDPQAYDRPRFTSDKTGPYDLSDPFDNHFAWLKTNHNLGGHLDWFAQFGWIMLCPPGEPPFPFLGRISLGQAHLTEADPELVPNAGEHDALSWSTFTTLHVHPRTLEPVDEMRNPYTGELMDLSPIKYADRLAIRLGQSIVVPGVNPKFYEQPWDRENGFSQHFYDAGDEIVYTVLGAAQKPGPMQPRLDVAHWNVSRKDLMDPTKNSIHCRRYYSAVFNASEYKFTTVPMGDETQMFVQTQGVRTSNLAMVPAPVHYILENFKDRFKFT